MTIRPSSSKQWVHWVGRGAVVLAFTAGVAVLLFWLAGRFSPKVPVNAGGEPSGASRIASEVVEVRMVTLPLSESAVGTIRAVHEMAIGSKLLVRVMEVNLKAGQEVKANDVLFRLDDTDLRAKLEQTKATVKSIEAVRTQAKSDEQRNATLMQSNAISRQEYEKSVTAVRSAEADLQRAEQTVNEVQATLDWATVRSPIDGTVIDKKVDVGDMVTPGQMLVTLYDPKQMQLVANVRESLTRQLQVGQTIAVRIDGLDKQCSGTVSEIVPEAQSSSRAFQVKVTGPCPAGIYSGMFGRILIPLGEEQVLILPRTAVRHVGQLELVQVVANGQVIQRAIRTGRTLGDVHDSAGKALQDQVEVLSGLRPGEQVVVPADSLSGQATPRGASVGPGTASSQETTHE